MANKSSVHRLSSNLTKNGAEVQICGQDHDLPSVKENVGQTPKSLEKHFMLSCCYYSCCFYNFISGNEIFSHCMKTLTLTRYGKELSKSF